MTEDASNGQVPNRRPFERAVGHPIMLVQAPRRARRLIDRLTNLRPLFVCTAAHTETAEIDGLSAAGATARLRRLTATADVEALHHGRPRCMRGVPSNPLGAPGPVIITLAALRLARIPVQILDAGLRVKPDAPTRVIADRWGASILTGHAVPHAEELYRAGLEIGQELAAQYDYLILAETVPAGTTTALALLCGLGIDAWGMVSSSMPGNAHRLKNAVVRRALAAAGLERTADGPPVGRRHPLEVAAAVGDPMQPVVAGLTLGALGRVPVMLAGGSQMAAVAALVLRIAQRDRRRLEWDDLTVATTRWVALDPTADLAALAALIGNLTVVASDLSFAASRHAALRRYEDGLVKEGVGAGGAAVAAALSAGVNRRQLMAETEAVYADVCDVGDSPVPDRIDRDRA